MYVQEMYVFGGALGPGCCLRADCARLGPAAGGRRGTSFAGHS